MQGFQNRVHRGQDVGLRPSQRRKSQDGQAAFQRAKIAATKGQVMQEIPGTVSVVRMHLIEPLAWQQGRVGHHVSPDGRKFSKEVLDVRALKNAAIQMIRRHRHPLHPFEVDYPACAFSMYRSAIWV